MEEAAVRLISDSEMLRTLLTIQATPAAVEVETGAVKANREAIKVKVSRVAIRVKVNKAATVVSTVLCTSSEHC